MANYTSIHCGPDGRHSLRSPARTWPLRSGEAPRPPDHLRLFLAKAGMAQGWWNVCSTDRLWHLALVIFVTKCPPAYGMGQDCHNLAKQSSSEYSCCATLCHLWQQRLANNCYILSIPKAFNLYCSEMLYFSRAGHFIPFNISSYRSLTINNKVVSRGLTSGW